MPVLTEMDETRRETSNKSKRLKADRMKQIIRSYIQRRNYVSAPANRTFHEFVRMQYTLTKVSQPGLLYYACWNSKDALLIDSSFCKFITWLRDIQMRVGPTELDNLIAPLFCYMYLELLKKGLLDYATSFFATYIESLDPGNCDNSVSELIAAIATNGFDVNGVRDVFRSNKYCVQLSSTACGLLRDFLARCHVVFLQMLTLWLEIEEVPSEDDDDEEVVEVLPTNRRKIQRARTIAKKHSTDALLIVDIKNVHENVTCGLLDAYNGNVMYSHNNAVHIRAAGTFRTVLERENCKEITMRYHSRPIVDMKLVEKHNFLATASLDNTVCLYDLDDHTSHSALIGHTHPVYSLASSYDGNYLSSGSYDSTIRLWSLATQSTLRLYAGHKLEITDLHFHPNSLYFASASADRVVRMWTIAVPTPVRLFYGSVGPVYSVRFSPDGRLIAFAGEDKLRVWDLASSKQLLTLKCGSKPVTHVCWSADQRSLVTGSLDGVVRKWNMSNLLANPANAKHCKPVVKRKLYTRLLNLDYSNGVFHCLTIRKYFDRPVKVRQPIVHRFSCSRHLNKALQSFAT